MKIALFAAAAAASISLSACGGQSPAESTAENMEEAAEYSTPEAANVLEDAADQIRDQNAQDPAVAQQALDAAGNAQAGNGAPPPTANGQ